MPLVNTKEMFKKAYDEGYAIGAFNVNNMEIVQGITDACQRLRSPVILQVSGSASQICPPCVSVQYGAGRGGGHRAAIALHLDHGADFEQCKDCIDGGFTSVMIDGSHLPYEENVAETKRWSSTPHARGITVEGELGQLAGVEDEVSVEADARPTIPIPIRYRICPAHRRGIPRHRHRHQPWRVQV